MIALIPMMGLGLRFLNSGYSEYKPFVRINTEPLIKKVIKELDKKFDKIYIVCNTEISKQLKSIFDDEVTIIELYCPTKGSAETIMKACEYLPDNKQIACFDCDTIFYKTCIEKVINNKGNFVLTFKDNDKSGLYSYVLLDDNNNIIDIQEKKAISNIANAGCYVFENKSIIENSVKDLMEIESENELYISALIKELINKDYKFKVIDVSNEFDCCGTPYQLKTFSKKSISDKKLTICFDIDGTLIYDLYTNPTAISKNVEFCKQAYKQGHQIILNTARGMLSTKSNYELIEEKRPYIEKVLSDNNIFYHELVLMKPYADLYIDDKAISAHKDLEKETGIYLFNDHSSRVHNKIIIDGDKIIKIGNLQGECYYYNNIPDDISNFFPKSHYLSNSRIEIEKINTPTYSSLLLSKKLTKEDIRILIKTINEIHSTSYNFSEMDLSWGYKDKIINRFEDEIEFYKKVNIKSDLLNYIYSLNEFKIGIIHGDPVFTNIFQYKSYCKFIDIRGIWENKTTICGDIFYDYAKILQSLYGYDYVLHNENIEEDYLFMLREYFFHEVKKLYPYINLEQLILKTKLLYISLLPLHKEDLNRCFKFIEILKNI
jgi:dTDP-glucose pyrophosphorylase